MLPSAGLPDTLALREAAACEVRPELGPELHILSSGNWVCDSTEPATDASNSCKQPVADDAGKPATHAGSYGPTTNSPAIIQLGRYGGR